MKLLFRLTKYGWRHKRMMTAAYTTVAVATVLKLVIPLLIGTSIDQILTSGDRERLFLYGGAILLISIVSGLVTYGQSYLIEAVSQRAAFDIRSDLFKKLQNMSFGFYDRYQTGNLMSRATGDVEAVRDFTTRGVLTVTTILFTFGVVSYFMLTTSLLLGIISMAVVPPVAFMAIAMRRRFTHLWTDVQAKTADMTTVLQENITGVKVVKSFGGQQHEQEKFSGIAETVANDTYAAETLSISRQSIMVFIFTALTGVVLWIGGTDVASGKMTAGELTTFVLYITLFMGPVRNISGLVKTFTRAYAAGKRLYEILDADSPVREKRRAKPIPRVRGAISFEDVSLAYNGSGPALQNVDITVEPGQLVAILGAPGSGKSSLVHLIPRFYDPTGGRITVDGTDLRDVKLASLRQNIGIVLQDVFVFSGTIHDNIAYGRSDATDEDVERAAKIAQLHEHIITLPLDYDTMVGERGVTLSGGQRQRLAIARTVLLDPPILILDDSTSSVDPQTEAQIQKALSELVKGRTTFVIAHRLSTIRQADMIIVLDHGRVVERGTHVELLARGGHYRRIHDVQLEKKAEPEPTGILVAGGSE